MIEKMDRIFGKIEKAMEVLIVFLFAVVIISGFGQVVARQILHKSFVWSEELCRYAGIWMILLATAIAFKRNEHISLEYFLLKFPKNIQKVIMLINYAGMTLVMGWFCYYGWELIEKTGKVTSPAMKLPMGLVYISLILSGILSVLFILFSAIHYITEEGNR